MSRLILLGAALALTGCSTSAPATVTTTSAAPTAPDETLASTVDPYSQVGGLVDGFPRQLLPVPDGASVLLSSAEPTADSSLLVSLNLRTDQDTAGVLDAIRAPLLAAGFTETPIDPPSTGLAAQSTFARTDGAEVLIVAVLDQDGSRTVNIGGKVAAGTA